MIDTHCHLDSIKYQDDIDQVIQNSFDNGVNKIIIPGASIEDLPRAISLSEQYDDIYFAVGVHPYDIDNYDKQLLEKYINHKKCVAVGECGLDYYRLPDDQNERTKNIALQKEVFISQIELAKQYNKPLIIHIRDASNDSKEILLKHNSKQVGGVLHCFNADQQLLSLANEGFYFGIGGVVTFKNGKKLVNILPQIDRNRLVLETDAPYLTPEPHRGTRNEPAYTRFVAQKVAQLLDLTLNEVKNLTTTNAVRLFKI